MRGQALRFTTAVRKYNDQNRDNEAAQQERQHYHPACPDRSRKFWVLAQPRHNRIVEQRCRNREQKDNEAQEAQITQKVANDTE
jgi:hypothetical protein